MHPLTKNQKEMLDFIKAYHEEHGYTPSYAEIGRHFRLSSKATVAQYIKALEEKGYLTKTGSARGISITEPLEFSRAVELPLVGLIAAGAPIEAIEEKETMQIPSDLCHDPGKTFVLRVKGNSMIEDGILSGDYVVVEKHSSPQNGATVVALIDNSYATLKRFYKESARIRLQPANSAMKPIYAKNVAIQGIVRAVIRKIY